MLSRFCRDRLVGDRAGLQPVGAQGTQYFVGSLCGGLHWRRNKTSLGKLIAIWLLKYLVILSRAFNKVRCFCRTPQCCPPSSEWCFPIEITIALQTVCWLENTHHQNHCQRVQCNYKKSKTRPCRDITGASRLQNSSPSHWLTTV